jgi:2-polyprenyl-3-methyl-5-hydroxy-6-metoxy-1,4-benzoquinol methylase
VAMVAEFGSREVLDIGCGTGTFACLLAEQGYSVIGLESAVASLEIARRKPYADRV